MKLTVDVEHRHTVTGRGFDIWAAGAAVAAMCVARGQAGMAGLANGLRVTLDILPAEPLGLGNGTNGF